MTILYLNGIFKLPDDFSGNFTEALEEYVKYRKAQEIKAELSDPVSETIPQELWDSAFAAFERGFRFHGHVFVGTHDGSEWHKLPID